MHTVELLEQALASARAMGYEVREEWLGGIGGGTCLVKGRWRLFVDLNQTPRERLELVLDTLASAAEPATIKFPATIQCLVQARRAA
jgi:hypothetical protein